MEEITANFSYEMIRLTGRILGFTWNRLYQGINVHNAERVRQLAHDGHELVYVPCHPQPHGLPAAFLRAVSPGAGAAAYRRWDQLNFWPAGPIFPPSGGVLYSPVLLSVINFIPPFSVRYLGELFSRGYSVEYFVEGGRSRTGRLLDPKTGTLSMTIQAMLRGGTGDPIG